MTNEIHISEDFVDEVKVQVEVKLRSFIERIERLEEEKKALGGDIKQVYSEAKVCGFDTKIMRKIVQVRRLDAATRREQEEIYEIYKRALGL